MTGFDETARHFHLTSPLIHAKLSTYVEMHDEREE